MDSELETARLRLRPFTRADLDTLARWYADPVVMHHMGRPPMSRDNVEKMLERHIRHREEHDFGLWAAEEKTTGRLIGRIGLAIHPEWPEEPEVGWMIDPAHWGQGLATEGGRASIRFGFEQLGAARIVSICTPDNLASRRVMQKLGLRRLSQKTHSTLGILLWIHGVNREPTDT